MDIYQRPMTHKYVQSVKELIEKTLLNRSMLKVYEPSEIAAWNNNYDIETLTKIVDTTHAYLLLEKDTDKILATGYINLTEDGCSAHIGMIFTDFEVRNKGLGRAMIHILEHDEYANMVDKIILGSSLSAYRFYSKLGYRCKDNEYQILKELDAYSIPMEKFTKDID